MLGNVDLNLLVTLDALLIERNVTRAAARLSMGQPAMSASLARLRKHFDDPLLARNGREYVLTTLAESLVDPVRTAVMAADAVLSRPRNFDPAAERRTFTIIASDYVSLVLLRPFLADLETEAPAVTIAISNIGADNDERLRRGSADLLIFPSELNRELADLPRTELFSDRFVLVADRDNPYLAGGVDPDRFADLHYLSLTGGQPSLVEAQLDAQGIVRRAEVLTESFAVAPLMVLGTRLVAVVQERLARFVAAGTSLQIMDPPFPLRPLTEAMWWNPRTTDDPAHRWLRQSLLDRATSL